MRARQDHIKNFECYLWNTNGENEKIISKPFVD